MAAARGHRRDRRRRRAARGLRDPVRLQPRRRARGRRRRRARGAHAAARPRPTPASSATPRATRPSSARSGREVRAAVPRPAMTSAGQDGRMRVTITGATGPDRTRLVRRACAARGDDVDGPLARRRQGARRRSASTPSPGSPSASPRPAAALAGRDGVIHLAGEDVAQRWSDEVKRRLLASRELGTRNLVAGLRAAEPAPRRARVGVRGRLLRPARRRAADRVHPAGRRLPRAGLRGWEREAAAAEELGMRVVRMRTGVALDKDGGALAKMLPFFRLGVGGPVAGGRQYMLLDPRRRPRRACTSRRSTARTGPAPSTRPRPSRAPTRSSAARSAARCTGRPSRRYPGFAVRALYGEMADIVADRPARGAGARAGARLPLRPSRARRGAAQRPRLSASTPCRLVYLYAGRNRHTSTRSPGSVSPMSHFDIRAERPEQDESAP